VRNVWKGLLRTLVSAALLASLFLFVDVREVRDDFLRATAPWLVAAAAVYLASNLLAALQWGILLRARRVRLPAGSLLAAYLVGLFFNNVLPGNVGGDIVKGFRAARISGGGKAIAGSIIADRVLGMAVLLVIGIPALVAARGEFPLALLLGLLSASLFSVAAAAFLFTRPAGAAARRVLSLLPWRRVRETLGGVVGEIGSYRDRLPAVALAAFVAAGVQTGHILMNYFVSRAMGFPIPALRFFALVPWIGVLTALPVTVAGLGWREWVGRFLFAAAGDPGGQAVSMLLLGHVVMIVVNLAGGLVYVFYPERARTAGRGKGRRRS
jgi:hypothetical protein